MIFHVVFFFEKPEVFITLRNDEASFHQNQSPRPRPGTTTPAIRSGVVLLVGTYSMVTQSRSRHSLLEGLRHTYEVSRHCVVSRLGEDFRFVFPAMLVLSSIGMELFAAYIMNVISSFYLSISSDDRAAFISCLWTSLFVVTVISLCVTFNKISIDACALQWREDLTAVLQNDFLGTQRKSYSLLRGVDSHASAPSTSAPAPATTAGRGGEGSHADKPPSSFDNPDQRIVQDPEKFANIMARILAKLVPLPAIIVYYTWYLWSLYGWVVPLSCYVYFVVSASITSALTHRLVAVIYAQDKLEGDLRFFHARYRINAESIAFISGERAELNKINGAFGKVCDNLRVLVVQRIPLYFFVTWFSYLGSIGMKYMLFLSISLTIFHFVLSHVVVNYAVIGFALLYLLNQQEMSEARAASLLAEGSYACLYLISSFSTLLDMSQKVSKLCGYSTRIVELMKYTPPAIDDVDIQYMKERTSDDRVDSVGKKRVLNQTSTSIPDRGPSFCTSWGAAFSSDVLCSCFAACSPTCDLSRTRALTQRIFHCIRRQQKLSSNGDSSSLLCGADDLSSSEYRTLSGDQPDDDGIFDKTLAAYNSGHGNVVFNDTTIHDAASSTDASGDLLIAYMGPGAEDAAMQYRMLSGERTFCSVDKSPLVPYNIASNNADFAIDSLKGEVMVDIRNLSVLLPMHARRSTYESAAPTYAISDLNLKIACGMRLLITGDSGCGKTTLLRVLCGLWSSKHGAGTSLHKGDVTFSCTKREVMFLPQVSYYTEVAFFKCCCGFAIKYTNCCLFLGFSRRKYHLPRCSG